MGKSFLIRRRRFRIGPVVVRLLLLAVALLAATNSPALAGPLYSVDMTGATAIQDTHPVTLSSSVDGPIFGIHGEGLAFSGSLLEASVQTSMDARGLLNGFSSKFDANLGATYDDIFIKGPAGGPVPVAIHVLFDAVFAQSYARLGDGDKSSLGQNAEFSA